MSVINKMLQGLEERRSDAESFSALRDQVRAAPAPSKPSSDKWMIATLAVLLCGVLFWIWHESTAEAVTASAPVPSIRPAPKTGPASSEKTATPASVAAVTPLSDVAASVAMNETPAQADAANKQDASAPPAAATSELTAPSNGSALASKTPAVVAQMKAAAPAGHDGVKETQDTLAKKAKSTGKISSSKGQTANVAAQSEVASAANAPTVLAKRIKELSPQQLAENEYRRASSLIQQGRFNEAITALEQALRLDPQHLSALQTLAGMLIEMKRYDEAIYKLREKLLLDRSHAPLAMMLARLQVSKGEVKMALATLEESLPYASNRADYQAFLAALYQREGQHKEAIERYMRALERSPQTGVWWLGLGISLQAQNRPSEARDAYWQAKESQLPAKDLQEFVAQRLAELH